MTLMERPPPKQSPQAGEQAGSDNDTTTRDATTGGQLTVKQMAALARVSERSMATFLKGYARAVPELHQLNKAGLVPSISVYSKIALQDEQEQRRIVAEVWAGKSIKAATANLQPCADDDGYARIVSAWNRATEVGRARFIDRIIQQANE